MSIQQRLARYGATPGKLALVGVLSLVLVAVIVGQLPERPEVSATTEAPPQATTQLESPKILNEETTSTIEVPPWPLISLETALSNDPFKQPSWIESELPGSIANTATPTEQESQLEALREQGASIVVIGKQERSATIGEKKYHIGDQLGGFRVRDITPQGVLLDTSSAN